MGWVRAGQEARRGVQPSPSLTDPALARGRARPWSLGPVPVRGAEFSKHHSTAPPDETDRVLCLGRPEHGGFVMKRGIHHKSLGPRLRRKNKRNNAQEGKEKSRTRRGASKVG
jgi:hypothetical protein